MDFPFSVQAATSLSAGATIIARSMLLSTASIRGWPASRTPAGCRQGRYCHCARSATCGQMPASQMFSDSGHSPWTSLASVSRASIRSQRTAPITSIPPWSVSGAQSPQHRAGALYQHVSPSSVHRRCSARPLERKLGNQRHNAAPSIPRRPRHASAPTDNQ
jgi:hypothetical protein